jgi:hypothetical protein
MQLQTLLLLAGLTLLAAAYFLWPLLGDWLLPGASLQDLSALRSEQKRLLDALRELDFDAGLGKVPAEDYPKERAELLRRGAELLRQLDEGRAALRQAEAMLPAVEPVTAALPPRADLSDAELEDLILARRIALQQRSGGFCPHCGKPVLSTDTFCPKCGTRLEL